MLEHPPIRIAFCHYTADVCGGSDRSLYNLVTRLPARGITPVLLLKTGDPMAAEYRACGLEVHELPFFPPRRALEWGKLLRFFLYFWPTVFRLVWLMRRHRVDLAHVNTVNNIQGGVAAWLARKPLVWHVRELVPASRSAAAVNALACRLSTAMIANSGAVAATLKHPRVHIIHNGIDLDLFETLPPRAQVRNELQIAADAPVIAVVGRLEAWKGQHVFIEAIPEILRAHPAARFLVVGGSAVNKPEYLPQLKARSVELGVDEAVCFSGIRKDIPAVLSATDVLVLPSVTPEPFGLTLIEAMAAGVPVVATAQGGPLEIVEDGKSGVLIAPDNAGALARAVVALLAEPEQREAMGRYARRRAFERFSLDRVGREAEQVFRECL
ncbi:MAG: glycosyltransferase family 4 protein [Candidatus Hydrogenedentes bacterium]|nr:glycosyltransferase family 4 protein [Candidatus Hydrogenedentota bacterium]